MTRRMDTQDVGDGGELEAARLLTQRGWSVENLNSTWRNHELYDLRAIRNGAEILISVKHARAKRHVRLGRPTIFRKLRDQDFLIILLPRKASEQTNIASGEYDVWVVPGHARHSALEAHVFYYGNDEVLAYSQSNMMIKDKNDTPNGRSKSGAVFREWEKLYRDAWHVLPTGTSA